MKSSLVKFVAVGVAVVWLFAVTFNYYIVHKPFTAENVLALLSAFGDVFVAVLMIILATAVGRRSLRAFTFATPLEAIIFQAGIGLGLISFATLALGLLGWLNRILFWVLALASVVLLRSDVQSLWRDVRTIHLPIESRFERWLAGLIALALGIGGLLALLPPIAWDAQTYHLVEAKVAITQGRITAPPDIPYFSFPALGEMLFLAGMLLKSDSVAQVLHFGFLMLTLGAMFALAQRYFSSTIAWLACALLVAVPSLLIDATWAYVDLALCFYALVALFAALIAIEQNEWRWFVLAGAFAGLAMGTKYTAVIVPIALACVWLLGNRKWSTLIGLLAFAALFASPWYLRNLALTGNPVYPFIFGGRYWDAFRAEWFSRFGTGFLNAPLALLTAPWDATIIGAEGALGYEATIGPLLLALLPLGLLVRKSPASNKRDPAPMLWVFALALYLFWLVGLAQSKLLLQTRLLFPAFPVFALIAAIVFDRLSAIDLAQFSLQRFVRLLLIVIFALTAMSYMIGFAASNPLPFLVGAESRATYLANHLGDYGKVVQSINTQLPANARVLALWEPRSYYIERAILPDAILDRWAHLRYQYHDAESIARWMRAEGFTHVLLYRAGLEQLLQSGYDPIPYDDVRELKKLMAEFLRPTFFGSADFPLVTIDGKPSIPNAAQQPYALYELAP